MRLATLSFTDTNIPTANSMTKEPTELQRYLDRIHWETAKYTNTKLETILTAGCLRFLAGMTDIEFVTGLAREIHKKYKRTMKLSLWYSTEILENISDQIARGEHFDIKTLHELVNDAQEMITKRRL